MAAYLYRRARLKGPFGGSKGWTVLWAVIIGRRVLKRLATDKPDIVYRKRLRPGEAVVISDRDRPAGIIGAGPPE